VRPMKPAPPVTSQDNLGVATGAEVMALIDHREAGINEAVDPRTTAQLASGPRGERALARAADAAAASS
jgi:hypothetical protein